MKMRGIGKKWDDRLLGCIMWSGVNGITRIGEGIARLATGGKIGSNVIVTILHGIPGTIFWGLCVPQFIENFLKVSLSQAKMIKGEEKEKMTKNITTLMKAMQAQKVFAFLTFTVMPCLTLVSDHPATMGIVSMIYYIFCLLMGVYIVFSAALPQISAMVAMMSESLKNAPSDKMQQTVDRLKIMEREAKNNGFSNAASCAVFVGLPLTYNLQSYQVCFGWTLSPLISMVMMYAFMPKEGKGGAKVGTTTTTTVD
jgi:hypothetical protein